MKFWIRSLLALALVACVGSMVFAQPPGGRGGRGGRGFGGGFGGFGGGGGGGLAMLANDDVRKELGLVDDQVSKLTALQEKLGTQMREAFQGGNFDFQNATEEERQKFRDDIQKKIQPITEAAQKEVDSILLPQQRERLKQITVQQRVQFGGTSGALVSDDIAKELGITDAQKEQIQKAAEEADVEMREKIEKVREEARQKILAVLTPAQKAQFEKLTGAKFEFSGGFGGFGGGGGRGGFGGGRGGAGAPGGGRGQPLRRPAEGD